MTNTIQPYQSFFEQTLHEWSEADESLYTQFVEYIVKTEYGNRLEEISIPTLLKDKIDFIKELAQQAEVKIIDLFKLFMHKEVFKLFQIIGWSLKALHDLLEKGLHIYRDVQNVIAEYIHKNHIVQWTKGELEKLDVFLSQHPKTKRIVGIGVAAFLLYAFFAGMSTGDYKEDLDISLIFTAFVGHVSLAHIFGTPAGTKLLLLFVTGVVLGWSFPYPLTNVAKLGFGILFTLGRYFHQKITKGIDVKESYIEVYEPYFEDQDDIKVGDELRIGKWKNKKAIVKGFGTDENNQPTVKTDKGEIPLYKFRISKLMTEDLHLSDFTKHAGESQFTKHFRLDRQKLKGTGNKSARIKELKINRKKDYISFIFESAPTYTTISKAVYLPSMEVGKEVRYYHEIIRIKDFFKLAETKPGYKEKEMTFQEVKEILQVASIAIFCDCPSFHWQGDNYIASMFDASVYPTVIAPKRWNKLHKDDNFACKHLDILFSSGLNIYINNMTSMINRWLKTGIK